MAPLSVGRIPRPAVACDFDPHSHESFVDILKRGCGVAADRLGNHYATGCCPLLSIPQQNTRYRAAENSVLCTSPPCFLQPFWTLAVSVVSPVLACAPRRVRLSRSGLPSILSGLSSPRSLLLHCPCVQSGALGSRPKRCRWQIRLKYILVGLCEIPRFATDRRQTNQPPPDPRRYEAKVRRCSVVSSWSRPKSTGGTLVPCTKKKERLCKKMQSVATCQFPANFPADFTKGRKVWTAHSERPAYPSLAKTNPPSLPPFLFRTLARVSHSLDNSGPAKDDAAEGQPCRPDGELHSTAPYRAERSVLEYTADNDNTFSVAPTRERRGGKPTGGCVVGSRSIIRRKRGNKSGAAIGQWQLCFLRACIVPRSC